MQSDGSDLKQALRNLRLMYHKYMKLKFKGLVCALILLSLCTNCFGMMDIMDVSREQAKAWGVTIRTNFGGGG